MSIVPTKNVLKRSDSGCFGMEREPSGEIPHRSSAGETQKLATFLNFADDGFCSRFPFPDLNPTPELEIF